MAIHSPEFRKKRRKRLRVRVGVFVGVAALLLGALVYVAHMSQLLIKEVEVLGNKVTADEEIESVARAALVGKYAYLFPRANAAIYPRAQIKGEIASQLPRIEEVLLDVVDDVLQVEVEERRPFALYCEDIASLSDPSGCYFLDESGLIFSEAPAFSGAVYFLYASSEPLGEPLRARFLPEEEFRSITDILHGLEKIGVETRALEHQREAGEYHLILPHRGRIIWKSEEDSDKVSYNLETFLLSEAASQDGFLERVLYIDLRFENKVFYKFQDNIDEE